MNKVIMYYPEQKHIFITDDEDPNYYIDENPGNCFTKEEVRSPTKKELIWWKIKLNAEISERNKQLHLIDEYLQYEDKT